MIKLEINGDDFVIFVDGKKVLVHTPSVPAFELGKAEIVMRKTKKRFKSFKKHYQPVKLRNWTLVKNDENSTILNFEGKLKVEAVCKNNDLKLYFSEYDTSINVFRIRLPIRRGENFYGLGERNCGQPIKGQRIGLQVGGKIKGADKENKKKTQDYSSNSSKFLSFIPLPCFISTAGYFVNIETTGSAIFDFRKSSKILIETWNIPKVFTIGVRRSASKAITALSDDTGRPPQLKPWAFSGGWLGVHGGTDAVLRKTQVVLDHGAKLGAIVVDDWCGFRQLKSGYVPKWDWIHDGKLYPGLDSTIADLKKVGIHFIGYVNPFFSVDGKLYKEARRKNYLVTNNYGDEYLFDMNSAGAALVDLTNQDAFEWMKNIIKENMAGIGMSGWLADYGEILPVDAVLSSGVKGPDANNKWPVLWAKLNYEALSEYECMNQDKNTHSDLHKNGNNDLQKRPAERCFFMRTGWNNSIQHVSGFWTGDQTLPLNPKYILPDIIPLALSLGFSGGCVWHSHVGGNVSKKWNNRLREAFIRWMEFAAFSPIMRTTENGKMDQDHDFWSEKLMLEHFGRCTEIHNAISPYHQAVMNEYSQEGLPPMRHTWLHYENDNEAYRHNYQYLYGRDLLISPVREYGKDLHDLYLPKDRWIHLWSSRVFNGGYITIEAPFGYPPVFYRESSNYSSIFDSVRRNIRKI